MNQIFVESVGFDQTSKFLPYPFSLKYLGIENNVTEKGLYVMHLFPLEFVSLEFRFNKNLRKEDDDVKHFFSSKPIVFHFSCFKSPEAGCYDG